MPIEKPSFEQRAKSQAGAKAARATHLQIMHLTPGRTNRPCEDDVQQSFASCMGILSTTMPHGRVDRKGSTHPYLACPLMGPIMDPFENHQAKISPNASRCSVF